MIDDFKRWWAWYAGPTMLTVAIIAAAALAFFLIT